MRSRLAPGPRWHQFEIQTCPSKEVLHLYRPGPQPQPGKEKKNPKRLLWRVAKSDCITTEFELKESLPGMVYQRSYSRIWQTAQGKTKTMLDTKDGNQGSQTPFSKHSLSPFPSTPGYSSLHLEAQYTIQQLSFHFPARFFFRPVFNSSGQQSHHLES